MQVLTLTLPESSGKVQRILRRGPQECTNSRDRPPGLSSASIRALNAEYSTHILPNAPSGNARPCRPLSAPPRAPADRPSNSPSLGPSGFPPPSSPELRDRSYSPCAALTPFDDPLCRRYLEMSVPASYPYLPSPRSCNCRR